MPAARRRLRRRRRRAPLYRSRWSQYNVLRTKCEYVTQILYPSNQNQPGPPYFNNSVGGNVPYITVPNMMDRYAKNTVLRNMFAFCTLTGIKVEVTPHSNNVSAAGISNQVPVCLAIVYGTNDQNVGLGFNDLCAVNTSMILDATQRQARYWSYHGGQMDLKIAQDTTAIGAATMIVRSLQDGVYTSSPSWNVKVTIYVLWRYAKVV